MNKHLNANFAKIFDTLPLLPGNYPPMTEAEAIAADLENNQDKTAKAHKAQERQAMNLQFQHQDPNYS